MAKKPMDAMDTFIAAAEQKPVGIIPNTTPYRTSNDTTLPWQEPQVRADVPRAFNLRLPEPLYLKLKWVADNSPQSMQEICLEALVPAIDAKLEGALALGADDAQRKRDALHEKHRGEMEALHRQQMAELD